ncbi:cation diffusion facilitator family transporter [Cognatishimia sp. MH4019]|uniref:cation diffusion facilitator family transporter n=1 Tax=Cognatishimia sp. MH4019 TaxID=2854030 RepID=UPI001CD6DFAE|nr:cation diffusion facilitator family transporter [Cognatishimia sp. MH4019]
MAHDHPRLDPGDKRVAAAVGVNFLLTFVQIIAGVLSGSLALIADAIHNFSDALSLVIAFAARRIARKPADAKMTFGYKRAEVVAALVNYTTLIVVAFYLAAEGVERLFNPVAVEGWIVVVVAGVALVIDTITALLIFKLSKDSMNMRAAFVHNMADALGSIAVIVAGTLILLYDWRLVDPIVTLGISAYILWHAIIGIKPVIRVLMLGSPSAVSAQDVMARLEDDPEVVDVHHMHLWMMGEYESSLDAHVVLRRFDHLEDVKIRLKEMLEAEFGIQHSVFEFELPGTHQGEAKDIGS